MSECPHCLNDIHPLATICGHCNRIAKDHTTCPFCNEPISVKASHCPYCTNKIPNNSELAIRSIESSIQATRWGMFFGGSITGIFFPSTLRITNGKIILKKWQFLGLRFTVQEIQVSRVASVEYKKGIFWGGIVIESFAGEGLDETGLVQMDAKMMSEKLKSVLVDKM